MCYTPDRAAYPAGRRLSSAVSVAYVYFYKLALALGPQRIAAVASQLGLGEPTGIDLPGETAGFLGTPSSVAAAGLPWYPGSTVDLGIGQGYLTATPLQDVRWTAAVASGSLVTPRLAARPAGQADFIPLPGHPPQPLPFVRRTVGHRRRPRCL